MCSCRLAGLGNGAWACFTDPIACRVFSAVLTSASATGWRVLNPALGKRTHTPAARRLLIGVVDGGGCAADDSYRPTGGGWRPPGRREAAEAAARPSASALT